MKMNDVLISVIIPMYNSENTIENTINSILNQEYINFEIILIDDGSIDSTLDKVKKLLDVDERIKLFCKQNGGVSSARNLGISKAKGDYLMFMDADDLIEKGYISSALKFLNYGIYDILIGGIAELYANGKKNYINHSFPEENIKLFLKNNFCKLYENKVLCSCCGKFFKRERIKKIKFDEKKTIGEDMLFVFEALKESNCIKSLSNDSYYLYVIESNRASITKRYTQNKCKNIEEIFWETLNFLKYFEIYEIGIDSAMKYYLRSMMIILSQANSFSKDEFHNTYDIIKNSDTFLKLKEMKLKSFENDIYIWAINNLNEFFLRKFVILRNHLKKPIKLILKC